MNLNGKIKSFRRELGLFDSTMIVVGSMIGSGIFIVSADIARGVGAGGFLLLVWLITGAVTLIGALSYGELAGMMPEAGGQYVYLRKAYNPLVGFLYGWTSFTVIQTGTIAAVGIAFAKFTSFLIPLFSENNVLMEIMGLKIRASQLLAIFSIALLTIINIYGIKPGKIIQDIFTTSKISALMGLILLGAFFGIGGTSAEINLSEFWGAQNVDPETGLIQTLTGFSLIAAIGSAMVGSLFSSDAWNNITFVAGEVKDPRRNIPLSLILGTGIVTVIYLLANVSYLLILPLRGDPAGTDVISQGIQFASQDRVGTAAATMIFGGAAGGIMAVLIMISTFGCNNGLILAGARVYYTMANDNLFFNIAKPLSKSGVPANALILQGIWASALCLSGSYSQLLDYVVFAVLLFYILTVCGIFILRKKVPHSKRPYRVPAYPFLPISYILLASGISIILLIYKPDYTWPGLIIVLLGIPVFYIRKKLI